MPDNKSHHFVPRFYLRNFSHSEKSVDLFNLRSGRLIKDAPIKGQCCRDYLYGKDIRNEQSLAAVEGTIANTFRSIRLHRRLPQPFTAGHFLLCFHVATQSGRTQYAGEAVNESIDKMVKATLNYDPRLAGKNLDAYSFGYDNPALAAVGHAALGFPLLMDLQCRLLFAPRGTEFITSDNPVVMYNRSMRWREHGGHTAFASKGLQIFLPLWPFVTLVMYDGDVYHFGKGKNDPIAIASKQDVHELNVLQAVSAAENVYMRGSRGDVFRVRDHAARFRRTNKANVVVFEGKEVEGNASHIVGTSNQDIRTDAALEFLRVHKRGRAWLTEFRAARYLPVAVPRDAALLQRFDAHREAVATGRSSTADVVQAMFGRRVVDNTF